jgi:hypothetical protein
VHGGAWGVVATIRKGLAMMISASDCMAKALEMDAKAVASTYKPAKALYELLAYEWRYSHDQAIWQDSAKPC